MKLNRIRNKWFVLCLLVILQYAFFLLLSKRTFEFVVWHFLTLLVVWDQNLIYEQVSLKERLKAFPCSSFLAAWWKSGWCLSNHFLSMREKTRNDRVARLKKWGLPCPESHHSGPDLLPLDPLAVQMKIAFLYYGSLCSSVLFIYFLFATFSWTKS